MITRTTLVLVAALAGCTVTGVFPCTEDSQCRMRGHPGTCTAAGTCAFDLPVLPDASTIDASTFDLSTCPAKFTFTIAARPNARYALVTPTGSGQGVGFVNDAKQCRQEFLGATHGANVTTKDVADQLAAALNPSAPSNRVYIGLVQDPAATDVPGSFINFDGTPVNPALWNVAEPNDGNGTENHIEDWGELINGGLINDTTKIQAYAMACECDGLPMSDIAAAYLGF